MHNKLMELTQETIQNILRQMNEPLEDTEYFLSMYLPADKSSKKDIRTRFGAMFEEIMHDYVKTKNPHNEYFNFKDTIQDQISSLDDIQNGIAVFARLNLSDHILNTDKVHANITSNTIQLPYMPSIETFVGKEFKLEQLLQNYQNIFQAISLSLNMNDYRIHKISSSQIEEISCIVADPSMEPLSRGGDFHIEHRKMTSIQDSIKESVQDTKKILEKETAGFLLVFYSASFSQNDIESYVNDAFSNPSNPEIIYIGKNLVDDKDIQQETINAVLLRKKEIIQKELEDISHIQNRYISDITDIIEYIGMQNVEKLYIKSKTRISKNDFEYDPTAAWISDIIKIPDPVDIIPRLIDKVFDASGEISIVDQMEYPIILRIRYALNQESTTSL